MGQNVKESVTACIILIDNGVYVSAFAENKALQLMEERWPDSYW
jgi:hypothetical protein